MICDSCRENIREEAGKHLDEETLEAVAASMGADLPDHLCDAVEAPPQSCGCACQGDRYRGRETAIIMP